MIRRAKKGIGRYEIGWYSAKAWKIIRASYGPYRMMDLHLLPQKLIQLVGKRLVIAYICTWPGQLKEIFIFTTVGIYNDSCEVCYVWLISGGSTCRFPTCCMCCVHSILFSLSKRTSLTNHTRMTTCICTGVAHQSGQILDSYMRVMGVVNTLLPRPSLYIIIAKYLQLWQCGN